MKQHNKRLILKPNNFEKVEERGAFFFSFFEPKCSLEAIHRLAYNVSGLAVSADNERQNGMRRTELKMN